MKVRVKKMVNIKGQGCEQGKEYEVGEGLGKWMVSKEIAEEVAPVKPTVQPKGVYEPAYDKFVSLVGHHTTQIYGDYGTGKSRFVHTVATEAQILGKEVLYIDTEGSLSPEHVKYLQNYEYLGDDLEALVKRVEKAKGDKDKYDLLIIDSIGLPVLNAYARWTLDKKLGAIQKLAPIMADSVRFARDGKGLSIVTNQCVSEFTRVSKKLSEEEPLAPFGGKISFVPKLILRSEPLVRDVQKSEFRLLVFKARDLPRGFEVARFTIDSGGVKIAWKV